MSGTIFKYGLLNQLESSEFKKIWQLVTQSHIATDSKQKWQQLHDKSKQFEESEDKETHPFSYNNLHKKLIYKVAEEPLKATIKGTSCLARRGMNGPFFKGIDFIYFITESASHKERCKDGIDFNKRKLKLHIALPEDDFRLRAMGWDCVKDIIISHEIALSKVLCEGVKMSESNLRGQEAGGQRGKDITIYVDNNLNLEFKDWLIIINEITAAFQKAGVPGGCCQQQKVRGPVKQYLTILTVLIAMRLMITQKILILATRLGSI